MTATVLAHPTLTNSASGHQALTELQNRHGLLAVVTGSRVRLHQVSAPRPPVPVDLQDDDFGPFGGDAA
tara:strand:+ start:30634 stop:30840 length:207 start_codon:yes stop_codon:yes gene_type:complete